MVKQQCTPVPGADTLHSLRYLEISSYLLPIYARALSENSRQGGVIDAEPLEEKLVLEVRLGSLQNDNYRNGKRQSNRYKL
jgi:hypothetical protein